MVIPGMPMQQQSPGMGESSSMMSGSSSISNTSLSHQLQQQQQQHQQQKQAQQQQQQLQQLQQQQQQLQQQQQQMQQQKQQQHQQQKQQLTQQQQLAQQTAATQALINAVSGQASATGQMPTAADIGMMLSLGLGLNPNDASQLANWDFQKLAMLLVSLWTNECLFEGDKNN